MKKIREYSLSELGYFSVIDCEAIKKKCEGTYMNIEVHWSNFAGNCTLIVVSDYGVEDMTYAESETAVKTMFLHRALTALRK